ncbi:MAG: hypothetical protein ABIE55_03375, partial [Candidatus Aenigmatarchaeota archaeon]
MASIIEIIQEFYSYFYVHVSGIIGETYYQLFALTIGLSLYSIFVWYFYKTLSKRDLFKINLQKYNVSDVKHMTLSKVGSVLIYIMKYGFIFPVYIFFWFLILSLFILVLSEEIAISTILLLSIAVVSTTRAISYYKEDLSNDLAKLIPFALLAVSLTGINFFSFDATVVRLLEIPTLWSEVMQFLVFSIVLEWCL